MARVVACWGWAGTCASVESIHVGVGVVGARCACRGVVGCASGHTGGLPPFCFDIRRTVVNELRCASLGIDPDDESGDDTTA